MKTRRKDIQKAAYDLVGTEGLESLHARTVAAELGINHATVHYYFPRRVDLLVGVVDFLEEQLSFDRARFQEGLDSDGDQLEAELALAEAYCKRFSRFAKVLAGLYVAGVAEPVVKKRLTGIWQSWTGEFAKLIPGAKVKKSSPYSDAELLAGTLFGFMLAAHLTDGKFDAKSKIDDIFNSMFG